VLSALLTGAPGEALSAAAVLPFAVLLAVAVVLAGRRQWPLSARRALLFFLLFALLALGAALLPPASLAAAWPGLRVASRILALVGLVEAIQFLLIDLALAGWLKRPPVPRILRDFTTLVIAVTAFLLLLRGTLGVNLSSLLATSAMISVVLGLALQDTLGSFFAGLALQMEAPLAIDDWVQVGEHQGRVSQVSWRTVRLVTLDGDEVTLPNSLVTRTTLLNFSRPTSAHRAFVPVRVPYRHRPQQVLEALTEAMRGVPGVLEDPPPHALVWEYGESDVVYRARYWIRDYRQVNFIRSEVAARIWYRLRREGIEHAYPARVLRPDSPAAVPEDDARRAEGALRAVDLFVPLSDEERRALAARLRPLAFGRGETVIRQGERGESLFVVTRGRVEIRVAGEGEEAVVSTLGAGSVFGEMSLLTGDPRTATVLALEDTEVFPVRREDFRHVAAANPAVLEAITRIVSDRRCELAAAMRENEEAAATRAAARRDLLERVRAFFGL